VAWDRGAAIDVRATAAPADANVTKPCPRAKRSESRADERGVRLRAFARFMIW